MKQNKLIELSIRHMFDHGVSILEICKEVDMNYDKVARILRRTDANRRRAEVFKFFAGLMRDSGKDLDSDEIHQLVLQTSKRYNVMGYDVYAMLNKQMEKELAPTRELMRYRYY